MILIILIALFSSIVVFFVSYILIRSVNDNDSKIYSKIVIECNNIECERNEQEEYRYKVPKDTLVDILPCPKCGKTRQIINFE